MEELQERRQAWKDTHTILAIVRKNCNKQAAGGLNQGSGLIKYCSTKEQKVVKCEPSNCETVKEIFMLWNKRKKEYQAKEEINGKI